ncbi:MAG: TonB-dependent receptor [Acidobacteriaceae bacterium]
MPLALQAQTNLGTILGTVKDSTGAVIPSASVTATQVSTNAEYKTTSNHLGYYSLQDLPIGNYVVLFHKAGFKDFQQSGIVMEAQHTLQVNAMLQVGTANQVVNVTSTPVLQLQTQVGTNLNAKEMNDLPLAIAGSGRDFTSFAAAITPNVNGGWLGSIAGSQAFTTGMYLDGTSTDSGIVGDLGEEEPSMDAIQEEQVDVAGLSAADGRTGGGTMDFEMKSGTRHFHGATFGFLDNEALNANDWTDNWYLSQCGSGPICAYNGEPTNTYGRPYYRYFDYGLSGGGPIWRKWLGLKKMYIFAAYEKYLQANWQANPVGGTVPTAAMLSGDFSALLPAAAVANGCTQSPCPIINKSTHEPYTDSAGNTIYYGSIFSPRGTVYPNNIITDPLSPIAQNIVKLYQQYYKPTESGAVENYPSLVNGFPWFHQTELSFKYDWDVSPSDHIAVSYIYNLRPRTSVSGLWQAGSQTGGPLTSSTQQTVLSNAYRGSETHMFTPDLLNIVDYTFNQFQNKSIPMTSIASSTNLASQVGLGVQPVGTLPVISFGGSPNGMGETSIGTDYNPKSGYVAYNGILNDTLTWTKGRHTMKFGGEYRALGFNDDYVGGNIRYNFSNLTYAPLVSAVQPFVGSAFANFLLGGVESATQSESITRDSRRKEISFFAEDDMRVTSRLTVVGSLRWELTRPLHVKNGIWSNYSITAPNQVYGGIPGAYTWLSNPNGSFETYTDWHQLAPKLGFSYQLAKNLVVRGSGGWNFVPIGWNGYSGTPYGSAVGYQAINQILEPAPNVPAFNWSTDAYAGVYTPATGPAPDNAAIQATWGPARVSPRTRELGFTENWYVGLEYQLPAQTVLDVSYMGNSGRNLHDGRLDPLNFPQWSTYQKLIQSGKEWNWVSNPGSAAFAGVPYPYPGFAGEAYFAIFPFPQIQADYAGGIFFTDDPIGQSGYNAITVEGKKQSGSLLLDLSYNWSRRTGNTGSAFIDTWTFNKYYQNPYDYRHEATYAPTYNIVKGFVTYMLPFGHGRRFLSGSGRLLSDLVSGWEGTGEVFYQDGSILGAVGSTNYYPGWSAVYTDVTPGASFKNTFKRFDPAWNPTIKGEGPYPDSLFVNPANFSNPTYGQLGTSPTSFTGQYGYPKWRGWMNPSENATILKSTQFGPNSRYTLILRADFFNVFNRHYWSNPNESFGSAYFGHVTGASGNRTGQLGARFEW